MVTAMSSLGLLAADPYLRSAVIMDELSRDFRVEDFADWERCDPATLAARCRSVEIVLTGRRSPRLPDELVADRGRLRWLCHLHGTVKHLVSKRHIEAGLLVTNWGDSVGRVAEGAVAILFACLKQVVALDAFVKGGADRRVWQAYPCTLEGRDVGIYGIGPIGWHVARMLAPFGARIAAYDPYAADLPEGVRRCASLRELFASCQAVSVHCGLNDGTRLSVTRELLELLPQGGILVNTARGEIVDEDALAALVGAGRLIAGVDTVRGEHVALSPLKPFPNALLTGHVIGSGKGYEPGTEPPPKLPDFVRENLAAWRAGRPLRHVVGADEYDLKT